MPQIHKALVFSLLFLAAGLAPVYGQGLKTLHGHVPEAVTRLTPVGRLPATSQMRLAIGLPLRDPPGLDALLAELYDPSSPNYHQFLTPQELADRFGPTEQDYEAVKAFARSNGLAIAGTFDNRMVLDVTGPAAAVEKALGITLHTYQHPTEGRKFFAPDTEPVVAADLPVVDVQGLSDYSKPHPLFTKRDVTKLVSKNGSAPDGSSFFGNDFRNAYAVGTSLTGAGQIVGVLEFDGYYANDIAAYASQAGGGRSSISVQAVLVDGFNGTPQNANANVEVSLDIEMAMAIAPGLSKIISFEAGESGSPNDVLNSMLSYASTVKQLSSSWGWGGGPSTTIDNIFKSMSAAGQSFFNASGDSDAFTSGAGSVNGVDNPNVQNAPSSSPYITQVGATTMTMNGTGSSYSSETVWNWGGGTGSSGGVSSSYSMPTWQANVSNMTGRGGSSSQRNIPDVACAGDNVYVISGGSGAGSGGIGGTSCAAPLWAGFIALVNQQTAASGLKPVGFVNPALYTIAASSSYTSCFHDVTTGNNTWSSSPSLFKAQTGYDLCTGLGTPNGQSLISALAGPADALGISPSGGFSFSGPASGPFSPGPGAFQLTNGSSSSLNWSCVSTSAWFKVSATNGTLAAHATASPVLNFTATASNLALGTFSATLLFSNQTSHVVQSVPISLQVNQPLSVSPAKGFSAVSAAVGGPFSSASQSFVVTNLGNAMVNWGIINTSSWLTVSASSGSLAASGSASVTAGLAVSANKLAAGVYNASLVFTDSLGTVMSVSSSVSIGQPILVNGGFETGDFTGWTLSGNTASTTVTAQTNAAGYVHSGVFAALLGPPTVPGYLSQNLTTLPGQSYVLSLWLRNPTSQTPNWFQVQWNGATLYAETNAALNNWTNLQFLVTASSSTTVLQFGFQNDPDYLALDDVNVTPLNNVGFKSTVRSVNNFQLAWNATTGLVYQVQYKTNLLQTNWLNLGGAIAANTNTLSVTDTNAFKNSPRRYYRYQVVQ